MTINLGTHNSETQTACEQFTWHEQSYNTTGTHTYDYTNTDGCPSTDTLHLTINLGTHNSETQTACEQFTWHEQSYTTTGTYIFNYNNNDGCPSADTLHLTVNQESHTLFEAEACDEYRWHDSTYTVSTAEPLHTEPNAVGCDSTTRLHLTLHHGDTTLDRERACDTFRWATSGRVYTATGNDTVLLQNQWGCDSLCVLLLTVDSSTRVEQRVDGCGAAVWRDTLYRADTTLTYHLRTTTDCDSTVCVHLRVHQPPTATMALSRDHLTETELTLIATDATAGRHTRVWWVDGTEFDTSRSIVCEASMSADSVRLLLAVSDSHCTDTTTKAIAVWHEELVVPNIFHPKAENRENSRFRAYGRNIHDFEITIFSRRGQRVFHSRDINAEWDGTHNGRPCPQGTYVYTISYTTPSSGGKPRKKNGTVMLVR